MVECKPYQLLNLSPGAGLRSTHFPDLLDRRTNDIEWFEIITENFLTTQGRPRWVLEQIRKDYPLAFHGVSLSIGGPDPIDLEYLNLLKQLIHDFAPFMISDHFCWTGLKANNTHNLLPLPLNKRTLEYIIPRISMVQDYLQRSMIFENASAYMHMIEDEMTEWEFITEVCDRTGCGILLDINNLYVTSINFNKEPEKILKQVPSAHVRQIHLAGHTDMGNYLFDTHSTAVQSPVWDLYRNWLAAHGPSPTMIEWDEDIPSLDVLELEANKIRSLQKSLFHHDFSEGSKLEF